MSHDNFNRALAVAALLEQSRGVAFGPASRDERIVFGAPMPGYGARSIPSSVVLKWVAAIKRAGIKRVCCLLGRDQLSYFEEDLLETYRREFGAGYVLWVPIADYCLCDVSSLKKIVLFLTESDASVLPTVVHCAGGRGRTGFVLAAWLVCGRGFEVEKALETVRDAGRNPFEASQAGNATAEDVYRLLESCRL